MTGQFVVLLLGAGAAGGIINTMGHFDVSFISSDVVAGFIINMIGQSGI